MDSLLRVLFPEADISSPRHKSNGRQCGNHCTQSVLGLLWSPGSHSGLHWMVFLSPCSSGKTETWLLCLTQGHPISRGQSSDSIPCSGLYTPPHLLRRKIQAPLIGSQGLLPHAAKLPVFFPHTHPSCWGISPFFILLLNHSSLFWDLCLKQTCQKSASCLISPIREL